MRRAVRQRGFLRAAIASLLLLTACASPYETIGAAAGMMDLDLLDYFIGDVNLAEKNYAAADYLSSRAKGYVQQSHSIKALPLLDEDEPRLETSFGREVSEQIGERFNQLGYNVDLTGVKTGVDINNAATRRTSVTNPDFIIGGSYKRKTSTIDVKIIVQDARSGIERAMFQYTLPRRGTIRDKSKPAPTIVQLEDGTAVQTDTYQIETVPDHQMHGNK